jgi:hypothetical protein
MNRIGYERHSRTTMNDAHKKQAPTIDAPPEAF